MHVHEKKNIKTMRGSHRYQIPHNYRRVVTRYRPSEYGGYVSFETALFLGMGIVIIGLLAR